jgi:hypothetical protein
MIKQNLITLPYFFIVHAFADQSPLTDTLQQIYRKNLIRVYGLFSGDGRED